MARTNLFSKFLVSNLQNAFFLSKILGLSDIAYNERTQELHRNDALSKYSRCMLIVWLFTALPVAFHIWIFATPRKPESSSAMQTKCICVLDMLQMWLGVTTVYLNHARNKRLQLKILNAIVKCNRNVMKLCHTGALSGKGFHTFVVIRIIGGAVDIYLTWNRQVPLNMFLLENEYLITCHRVVMMSIFINWHCVQTHLTAAMDAMKDFLESKGYNLEARDYHSLSRLYTQLFRIQEATCSYYQPFALASCASLLRTIVLAYHTFQGLLLTKLKHTPLESTVYTFKVLMIPGLMTALDFVMICIMAESLSRSADSYRWTFLMQSLKTQGDESSQRTIEMILRQSCWEKFNWMLPTGHSISRATGFLLLDASIGLTVAFLIYDGGRSLIGRLLMFDVFSLDRYQYYLIVFAFGVGCMTCDKVIAWCQSGVSRAV